MSGTVAGGRKAAVTNKLKYGDSFYRVLGAKGGTQTHKSGKLYDIGFGGDPERARTAGKKGGSVSRRGKAKPNGQQLEDLLHYEKPKLKLKQFNIFRKRG